MWSKVLRKQVHFKPRKRYISSFNSVERQYNARYISSTGSGGIGKWVRKKVYGTIIVLGVTAGGVLVFHYWVRSQMDKYSWIEQYYPVNVGSRLSTGLDRALDWFKDNKSSPMSAQKSTGASRESESGTLGSDSIRVRDLEKEMRLLQRKLDNTEQENLELRKEISKYSGVNPNAVRPGQRTLIDMYSDVLNLLTEFDSKSPLTDRKLVHTLPQVVVVGDQSAGKTSVLEMVAGARIFPRGGGEMMTRSPVMVTLGEGSDHIAMFNDSSRVYDLKKEDELKSLRKEIENRMKSSVARGETISSQPIAITVKGPQLKRMVLIDLPGIINTVTTGMAENTRSQIIKLCRQYMTNPNAIIMCIQDGSVDAERSIVTDIVSQMDLEGHRTIFVLTKADLAETSGLKQERVTSILDGRLFPMKAKGYFAVITGRGNTGDSIEQIQKYERDYFAKSKLFQNGMLRENQLGTRSMINAVTDEFWAMVDTSINDQALLFKTLRYNLEAEWRNKFPGERTLDRNDLFELGKADILNQVASLQVLPPLEWEEILMNSLWEEIGSKVLDDIYVKAVESQSPDMLRTTCCSKLETMPTSSSTNIKAVCDMLLEGETMSTSSNTSIKGMMMFVYRVIDPIDNCVFVLVMSEFNTIVDIELHKWADSLQLASSCANVGMATMFNQLHTKLTNLEKGKFNTLSQGLREEVEKISQEGHKWETYNVDQLKYVQMSALDDKVIRTSEQWKASVDFMKNTLKKQVKKAEGDIVALQGPVSLSDRWLGWKSQSKEEIEQQAIVEELNKFLSAEPTHPSKLFPDEQLTVQRTLKNRGFIVSDDKISSVWKSVYRLHFLRNGEHQAQKCQRGFVLREHSTEYACPEVTFFWRVQQVMRSSAHTLRVQILDREVRQLEQHVKITLDQIGTDERKKKELIRGGAVDKAEQLKQVRLIQEKLNAFKEALSKQQKRQ